MDDNQKAIENGYKKLLKAVLEPKRSLRKSEEKWLREVKGEDTRNHKNR